jgi:lipopolysaccharide transport system permease protein
MIVFTIVFSKVAKLSSGSVPYPLMVYAGMLPWQFFSNALSESSNSLITNANMLTKVYFPRMVVPVSAVIVSLIDFLISLVILVLLMAWYRFVPDWRILILPVFLAFAFAASFGSGLWLAALNVRYRDFRYIVPFIVQFGLYISPVGFSSDVVPEQWRFIYSLNPMVGIIDGFRWAILGESAHIYWPGFALSMMITLLLVFIGISYFRKTERVLADVI